jgi:hypothetical protein
VADDAFFIGNSDAGMRAGILTIWAKWLSDFQALESDGASAFYFKTADNFTDATRFLLTAKLPAEMLQKRQEKCQPFKGRLFSCLIFVL